jgi:hypothetical protein
VKRSAILDRAIDPAWLDLALRLASEQDTDAGDQRTDLEMALRDRIPASEGRAKTVKILVRVWLRPDDPAQPIVRWALERADEVGDSRVLHIGALMASYPFFGRACSIIGRELSLHGEILTAQLRKRLRAEWGDREIVDVSTRGAVRTLRSLGILQGKLRSPRSTPGKPLVVEDFLRPWLIHSLLIMRGVDSIDSREVQRAPELFMFKLPLNEGQSYPLLEAFSEGGGRVVFQLKQEPSVADPAHPRNVVSFGGGADSLPMRRADLT